MFSYATDCGVARRGLDTQSRYRLWRGVDWTLSHATDCGVAWTGHSVTLQTVAWRGLDTVTAAPCDCETTTLSLSLHSLRPFSLQEINQCVN